MLPQLIQMLNSPSPGLCCWKFATSLQSPCEIQTTPVFVGRWVGEPCYVVVGEIHAVRQAGDFLKVGARFIVATWPGWRISNVTVENLQTLVEERRTAGGEQTKEDVFVFQLFGN
jgi:hypothetical protein